MEFNLGRFVVDVAVDFGPRITGLRTPGGPNLLAVLPPEVAVGSEDDPYRFMGGHRVWAAPEIAEVTYAPDQHVCSVGRVDDTIVVKAPEDRAGVIKEISISGDETTVTVTNHLRLAKNLGAEFAAWSVTQFPLGGTALLPLIGEDTTPLPNRTLVLWPYTSLNDHRISFTEDSVIIDASGSDPLKLGTGPSPGRIGYWRGSHLFVKTIEGAGRRDTPDMGASGQVYVGNGFCELESVGEMQPARQGATAVLTECWSVFECPNLESATAIMASGTTS